MNRFRHLRRLKFELIRRCHVAWGRRVMRKISETGGDLEFQCNICGTSSKSRLRDVCDRETPSCSRCGSTLRLRSIVHLLSVELFGESLILSDFPEDERISGLGMSDWEAYAVPLSEKLVPSRGPVRFVLELAAGRTREIGLQRGDRVIHDRMPDP